MNWNFDMLLTISWLSIFLLAGTFLKRKVAFFRKFLVPNSVIAGFLALLFGQEFLGIVNFTTQGMGQLVYHLLAVGFIALSLKERQEGKIRVTKVSLFIIGIYLIQAIIGLSFTMILIYTIMPDLFPTFGFLLPFGFGQGPGQAYNLGSEWEKLGFTGGGSIGLSIATLGFLWACFGGIFLVNFLIRKKGLHKEEPGDPTTHKITETDDSGDIPLSESIDRMTIQAALVAITYMIAYYAMSLAAKAVEPLGGLGNTLASLFWGFNYLFSILVAISIRKIMDALKKANIMHRSYTNNFLLSRMANTAFDYMVTAAIAAISISVFKDYWLPTLLTTTIGGLVTMWYSYRAARLAIGHNVLEYTAGFYATYTGTLSTGMAFIREVDPDFKTKVADNLILASGMAVFFAFPLLAVVNLPVVGYTTGQPLYYAYTIGAIGAYYLVVHYFLFKKKKK